MLKTPDEIAMEIASNLQARRKQRKLTQEQLSIKSGVSLGSLKRFERTGQISLCFLLKIALVMDCEEEFLNLFKKKEYQSIQEIIDEQD